MKKIVILLCLLVTSMVSQGINAQTTVSDSLYPLTDKEILKLSSLIYELEKKDSEFVANHPNHFDLRNKTTVAEKPLLVDLTPDSVHYYTGPELIKLSNYIYELEKRDSIRRAEELAKLNAAAEYQLAEEDELQYFESVIYFNFDSYAILPEYHGKLDEVVKILDTYKNLSFAIEGYCDVIGSKDYNNKLSLRRANSVKDYFVKKKKIDAKRIVTIVGYGADKFAAPNDTPANRAKNRRVIIKAVH